jgi:hypothetical protein
MHRCATKHEKQLQFCSQETKLNKDLGVQIHVKMKSFGRIDAAVAEVVPWNNYELLFSKIEACSSKNGSLQ